MSGKQQTVRLEKRHESLEDVVLGRFVEVDHHVTAEHDVERPLQRPAPVEQVDPLELDQALQLVMLGDRLLPLEGGKLAQLHLEDGARLHLVDVEQLDQSVTRGLDRAAAPDEGDDLVERVERLAIARRDLAQPLPGLDRALAVAETEPMQPLTRSIERMGRLVSLRLRDVLDAYTSGELDGALAVWASDDEVDEHYNALFRELLTYMMGDPRTINACTHLLFMAKNLERIGDHATNIAETVHYEITGDEMIGERPRGAPGETTVAAPVSEA